MKRRNVWSRDFTLITAGTVISAIAGQTISLPLSLMVFDQTQSALLSAIMFVSSMLPNFVLPLFVAPLIDRCNKKRTIVTLDYLTGALYLLVAAIVAKTGFNYQLFVFFSLVVGSIGSIYQLTYTAWYPDLIPVGFEQQGFAVSSSIYPTVIMVMSPVAAWLYKTYPFHLILIIISLLTLIAATVELFIGNQGLRRREGRLRWQDYLADCKAGIAYLRKEKGLRNIYSYMAITGGVGTGNHLMAQLIFNRQLSDCNHAGLPAHSRDPGPHTGRTGAVRSISSPRGDTALRNLSICPMRPWTCCCCSCPIRQW